RAGGGQAAPRARIAGQQLREHPQNAGARSCKGMADRHTAALHIETRLIDVTERRAAAEPLAAVLGRLPRLEQAEWHGRESLVDLVIIEVLQGEPLILKYGRDRVGGRHQQPLAASGEIHRPALASHEPRKYRQLAGS